MSKPIAVLISDIHFSLPTLELADKALRLAIAKANQLEVPLIVAGDLHDTKANLRGECVNAIIAAFLTCNKPPYVLIGNHDKINEKSEAHALNFLSPYATIVNRFRYPKSHTDADDIALVCYHHDTDELRRHLNNYAGSTIIMHQGILGSDSGEYMQDRSAISPDDVAGLRVISGHYHRRQTIALPDGGKWDYLGNPYSLNFGEADHPEKGFSVLMDDGSLEFVPTNLRRHYIIDVTIQELVGAKRQVMFLGDEQDLVWAKIRGSKQQLGCLTKADVANVLEVKQPFRLDLIPTDAQLTASTASRQLSKGDLLDSLIDSLTDVSEERIKRLKAKWKGLLE